MPVLIQVVYEFLSFLNIVQLAYFLNLVLGQLFFSDHLSVFLYVGCNHLVRKDRVDVVTQFGVFGKKAPDQVSAWTAHPGWQLYISCLYLLV
jgi:hypothetical protein